MAGAGYQLAKTLYTCAKSIKNAEKEIGMIAVEVKLTSTVLESLAGVLADGDITSLCSETLRSDARGAMDGCKGAFDELNRALKSTLEGRKDGRILFSKRARWPITKTKMATLQSYLERLKTTLMLMLDVLSLASKQTSQYVGSGVKLIVPNITTSDRGCKWIQEWRTTVRGSNALSGRTKIYIRGSWRHSLPLHRQHAR